jgi:transcriptional regulator of met regulon
LNFRRVSATSETARRPIRNLKILARQEFAQAEFLHTFEHQAYKAKIICAAERFAVAHRRKLIKAAALGGK